MYDHYVNQLERPESELEDLLEVLEATPHDYGIRAAVATVIEKILAERAPSALAGYRTMLHELESYRAYSFMPVSDLLIRHVWMSHFVYPDRPLLEACNEMVFEATHPLHNLPVFQPLLIACDHSARRFAQVLPASVDLLFNTGEISFHPGPDRQHFTLRYEGFPVSAWRYFLDGYYRGLLELFAETGTVKMQPIQDSVLEIHFELGRA